MAGTERLAILREMVVRQLQDAMNVPATDEDYWTPPQAAIEMGLHYQYIAQALLTGELSCDLREVRVAQGRQRGAVILSDSVASWYQDRAEEARTAGLTLAKYLSKRYSMQQIFESAGTDSPSLGDGVPDDLITIDLARQAFASQFRVDVADFDRAIELKTVIVYDVDGEKMVSEQDVVDIGEAMDSERGPMVKVLDDGPVILLHAANSLGLSVGELEAAVADGQIEVARDETVELISVVDWYDRVRKPKPGEAKNRYLLVRPDDEAQACDAAGLEPSIYGQVITVELTVPDIPSVVETIDTEFVEATIRKAVRFGVGAVLPVSDSVKRRTISVKMTSGMIVSMCFLTERDKIDMDTYLSLAAIGVDPAPG